MKKIELYCDVLLKNLKKYPKTQDNMSNYNFRKSMSDREKVIEYEIHIEDMLKTVARRLADFENSKDLSEFEQGRQLAYTEILDLIETRHKMILNVIDENR